MSDPADVLATLSSKVDEGDIEGAKDALAKMKIVMITMDMMSGDARECEIATSALEYGVLLAVADDGDMDSFQRYVNQVKPYYALSHMTHLPQDEVRVHRKCHILGLNLMHLLVENRLSEFHAELEQLSAHEAAHKFVTYPIQLERQLMVGSYEEVLQATQLSELPDPSYEFFVASLAQTVRDNIADCLEVGYKSMSLKDAAQMMRLEGGVDELKEYIAESREDWLLEGDEIVFQPPPVGRKATDIPSLKLMKQTLTYAAELERIV
jgi:26S proteasome regulatory subunit N12